MPCYGSKESQFSKEFIHLTWKRTGAAVRDRCLLLQTTTLMHLFAHHVCALFQLFPAYSYE